MKIKLSKDGVTKTCKLGFSWTVLFFSWMVPVSRLDIRWGLIMIGAALILPGLWAGYTYEVAGVLFRFNLAVLFNLVLACYYNAIFVAGLLDEGYLPVEGEDLEALFRYRLLVEEGEDAEA